MLFIGTAAKFAADFLSGIINGVVNKWMQMNESRKRGEAEAKNVAHEENAKRKAIHQSELNLASRCSTSSSSLNSHLARKKEREQRLHSAQIISMIK